MLDLYALCGKINVQMDELVFLCSSWLHGMLNDSKKPLDMEPRDALTVLLDSVYDILKPRGLKGKRVRISE